MMILLVVTIQLIFIPQRSLTLFFADVYNGVKTGSNYYLVGEDLKLNCTLSDDLLKTWKSDNLHFEKRNQNDASGTKTCFPMDRITIIDNSTAALTITNITVDHENVYFCQAGNCSDCEDCSETVGYTDEIKIQYGPKNVTNVTCFIYNWNDHMNCSWKHPVKYQDYGDTSVSVSNSSTVFCEGKLLENCSWSGDKFTVRDKYAVNITVNNNVTNVAASQIIIVNRNENVKPAPVTDLKVEELPNSCLLLSWNHTSSEDKVFQVCSPEAQGDFKVLTSNLNRSSYKECNIKPYTLYTFFVRCFPSGAKGYWSDPIFVNITTKLLFRPTVGPKVTNSSYVTFKCVNNSKAIQIYWQKQNPDTNTVINNYLIKKDGKILRNVTADYYTTTIQIECNSNNVWLDILAENAMGQSINPSSMLILQNFTVPAKVKETFSIEWSESLQAVWSHDNSNKTSYILYWCKGYFPAVCENQIDWAVISYPVTNFSLPRLDDDPTRYLYGISVSNDGHSSEIYWTDCLFKLNPSEIPAPSVEITSTDYSAVIMFSMKKCSYHNPIKITSFFIQYCEELQCNDTNYIMYASSDTSEVSLSLNPATSYYISVQGKIYDKLGEPTKKTFKTKDENVGVRRTWIIAAVLVPLLGFIITLTVACLVSHTRLKHLSSQYNERKQPIQDNLDFVVSMYKLKSFCCISFLLVHTLTLLSNIGTVLTTMKSSDLKKNVETKAKDRDIILKIETSRNGSELFVGDEINVTCSLTGKLLNLNLTVKDLRFEFQRPHVPRNEGQSMDTTHIVNTSTAVLAVNINYTGTYCCYIDRHIVHFSKELELMECTYDLMDIDYLPENVVNFSCIYFDWLSQMHCSWKHPIIYKKHENIIVVVKEEGTIHCNQTFINGFDFCQFNASYKKLENLTMTVSVIHNKANTKADWIYRVNLIDIFKPPPVYNLKVKSVSDDCLKLSWNHSSMTKMFFRVLHKSSRFSHFKILTQNVTETSFKVCSVSSYTIHNFSVDCKGSSGLRSDSTFTNYMTPESAPLDGPTITEGSYSISPNCINGLQDITLYWQDVKESARNGIILYYIISTENEILANVTSADYRSTIQIRCNISSFEIYISAHNHAGGSKKPSSLFIHKNYLVPDHIQHSFSVVLYDNKTVKAEWKINTNYFNSTVFWCQGSYKRCQGHIFWRVVEGKIFYFPLEIEHAKEYLFGISVKDFPQRQATGIYWTECLYKIHFKDHYLLSAQIYPDEESARIFIPPVKCSYKTLIKVTDYVIMFCPKSECFGPNARQLKVPTTLSEYKLSPMLANILYCVTIKFLSGDHEIFQKSFNVMPKPKTKSFMTKVLVTSLVISCLMLVTFVFIWIIVKKCSHSKKKALDLVDKNFSITF